LGLYASKILEQLKVVWWLDTGSLLGAYRDGKMIAHDDDFDIGVYASE
jgi:phosphorylcholine metabolism protein LicD